jgi:hypothetical protein
MDIYRTAKITEEFGNLTVLCAGSLKMEAVSFIETPPDYTPLHLRK